MICVGWQVHGAKVTWGVGSRRICRLLLSACSYPSSRGWCCAVRAKRRCLILVVSLRACKIVDTFPYFCSMSRSVGIFFLVFDGQAWLFLTHHMLGLLVSVSEGRVSCRHEHVLGPGPGLSDELCGLQSTWGNGCMGRRFSPPLQAVAAGLLVSFLGGMVSCRLGPVLVLCPFHYGGCSLLQRWHGCMRRRIPHHDASRHVKTKQPSCYATQRSAWAVKNSSARTEHQSRPVDLVPPTLKAATHATF